MKNIFLMNGADQRYKYYFTIKNNEPSILQTFEDVDIILVTIKELTDNPFAYRHHSKNMIWII